jgi:hypothetical protein
MKGQSLYSLVTAAALWLSAQADDIEAQLQARDLRIQKFEERFLDSLQWQHNNHTVKLVGYKKIIMSDPEIADLQHNIKTLPAEWEAFTNAYYDPHEKTMRVYFPVEGALMYHHGELVEASQMGEYPHHEMIGGDCHVVGRYKTNQVHGVEGNIVKDNIIFLAEPAPPVRVYGDRGNVFMYDFGWREGTHAHGHDRDHGRRNKREDGEKKGGSCKENHGGRVCSQVYNINHGRCPRDYSGCIDYNGWPKKNCNNHSDKWAFPNSDCFTAVARGHCWNEIPKKH